MTKRFMSQEDQFWVQDQIRSRFPVKPSRMERKDYHVFALTTAFQAADKPERKEYRGLLDRDDLVHLTAIPRTTIFDTLKRMPIKKEKDPNPPRTRGRWRVFFRLESQNQ